MARKSISRTISIEGVELRVDGTWYAASRGAREAGSGVQLEPDEPETFEMSAIYVADVDIADLLSAGRIEHVENTVLEELAGEEPDEYDPHA